MCKGLAPFTGGSERSAAADRKPLPCWVRRAVGQKRCWQKSLAEQLFGDSKALIQLDMSEYMEEISNVSRLIGLASRICGV